MNTRAKQVGLLLLTAAGVGVSAFVYYPYSGAALQQQNIELARQHASIVAADLRTDERFHSVRAVETARNGGSLLLVGTVDTEADLADLRTRIEQTHCPVGVTWSVEPLIATTQPFDNM